MNMKLFGLLIVVIGGLLLFSSLALGQACDTSDYCGNGVCCPGEDCSTCSDDCGVCVGDDDDDTGDDDTGDDDTPPPTTDATENMETLLEGYTYRRGSFPVQGGVIQGPIPITDPEYFD